MQVANVLCRLVFYKIKSKSAVNLVKSTYSNSKYVPKCPAVSETDLSKLDMFVKSSKRLFVVSGAGLSTESGIPDYRSEGYWQSISIR
jgi:hypothetical protein